MEKRAGGVSRGARLLGAFDRGNVRDEMPRKVVARIGTEPTRPHALRRGSAEIARVAEGGTSHALTKRPLREGDVFANLTFTTSHTVS